VCRKEIKKKRSENLPKKRRASINQLKLGRSQLKKQEPHLTLTKKQHVETRHFVSGKVPFMRKLKIMYENIKIQYLKESNRDEWIVFRPFANRLYPETRERNYDEDPASIFALHRTDSGTHFPDDTANEENERNIWITAKDIMNDSAIKNILRTTRPSLTIHQQAARAQFLMIHANLEFLHLFEKNMNSIKKENIVTFRSQLVCEGKNQRKIREELCKQQAIEEISDSISAEDPYTGSSSHKIVIEIQKTLKIGLMKLLVKRTVNSASIEREEILNSMISQILMCQLIGIEYMIFMVKELNINGRKMEQENSERSLWKVEGSLIGYFFCPINKARGSKNITHKIAWEPTWARGQVLTRTD